MKTQFTIKSYETKADFEKKKNPTVENLPTKKQAIKYAEIVGKTEEFYASIVTGKDFKQVFIY